MTTFSVQLVMVMYVQQYQNTNKNFLIAEYQIDGYLVCVYRCIGESGHVPNRNNEKTCQQHNEQLKSHISQTNLYVHYFSLFIFHIQAVFESSRLLVSLRILSVVLHKQDHCD